MRGDVIAFLEAFEQLAFRDAASAWMHMSFHTHLPWRVGAILSSRSPDSERRRAPCPCRRCRLYANQLRGKKRAPNYFAERELHGCL